MHSVAVHLDPSQYLAGYRPEVSALFLPTLSESRVGDEVAVRVAIHGQTIRATLFGKVSLVRRIGRPSLPPGVEVHLDRMSVAAAGFLAMAARGDPVEFRERTPRFAFEHELIVEHEGTSLKATSVNVSDSGCLLRWPARLPLVGDFVDIRVREGFFSPKARAVVCWSQPGGAVDRSVGLRIVSDGRAARAWRSFVERVASTGARAA